ncbi:MAG: GH1 family beta-glucosidase [Spirochaetes bacterium]|nr:GH1 family beta-glucosidase [Spirochaetota bacterium]
MGEFDFPRDFTWGVATAAYQVEGAVNEDGRGPSIWDDFCRKPGAISDGTNGDTAVDHYHRWRGDVDLMAGLGIGAYRFSMAWPRILPDGTGAVNRAGVDFYKRLIDALGEKGIEPWVTLYHWDLPSALEARGGWANRETSGAFARYADTCFREFLGRVRNWITFNEPWCSAYLGYRDGIHAPGRKDGTAALAAVHHLNLAHGMAVRAFRDSGKEGRIGIVWNPSMPRSATDRPEDVLAAEMAADRDTRMFSGPVTGKGYPERYLAAAGAKLPVERGDLALISAPVDFAGINYYSEGLVAANPDDPASPVPVPRWQETTVMGWPIVPEGLRRLLGAMATETGGIPLYVTENGAATRDEPDPADGLIHDAARIRYLGDHVAACARALADGVPLRGYFVWSLVDNFEWSFGFSRRFGLAYCDSATLERKPKDSYWFYRDLIAGRVDPR